MSFDVLTGHWLALLPQLPDKSVHTIVTSPPYWGLRNYAQCSCTLKYRLASETFKAWGKNIEGSSGQYGPGDPRCNGKPDPECKQCHGKGVIQQVLKDQLGMEKTFEEWVQKLVVGFREARRVLRDDGTLWLNLGDSYVTTAVKYGGSHGHVACRQDTNRGSVRRPKGKLTLPYKNLIGLPWRVAFGLQDDGWILRCDIVWDKQNSMPESVRDRPTRNHEYLFLFSKSEVYAYDYDAILEPTSPDTHARYARGRSKAHKWAAGGPPGEKPQTIAKSMEHMITGWAGARSRMHQDRDPKHDNKPRSRAPGINPKAAQNHPGSRQNPSFLGAILEIRDKRNKRSVWPIANEGYKGQHYATFPKDLVRPCILAGCPVGGTVLDVFAGVSTTGVVAMEYGRNYIGLELNPISAEEGRLRCAQVTPGLALSAAPEAVASPVARQAAEESHPTLL